MEGAKKNPARRNHYRGKRGQSTAASQPSFRTNGQPSRQNATSPPQQPLPEGPPRVSTPPLTETVPLDTPRFADLAKENLIHPVMLQTITEDLKFDHMMPVQAATLHDLLANRVDCLAQAKTGTGKTIAFLLPAIQTLINRKRTPGQNISLLVISPTRELALQIAKEANGLLRRLPQYRTCVAIGGTNKGSEEKAIFRGCDILVGTPGRLFDHLSDERIRDKFNSLDTLVLDEADRLLDMGFMNALRDIVKCLPDKEKSNRQGMLFSATIAPHVEKVAHLVLSKGYKFISTIPEGEVQTHERVPQGLVTVPTFSDVAAGLVGCIKSECAIEGVDTFKTIVFAPTAALADFYVAVLEKVPGIPNVSVLHSRVSQSKRTNTTNEFRNCKSGILVATDVVARGMDFPAVTNVFQVGIPSDKESYIHRLGRTGRAGAEGRGTLIVTQAESFFPKYTLKEITFENASADLSAKEEIRAIVERMDNQPKTYQAWMGYYKGHMKPMGWDSSELVRQANLYAREGLGSPDTPTIGKMVVGKMGLKGVKGLNVVADPPRQSRGGRQGGGGGGGEGRSVGSGGLGSVGGRGARGGGGASGGRGGGGGKAPSRA